MKSIFFILLFLQGCQVQKIETCADPTQEKSKSALKDLSDFTKKIKGCAINNDFEGFAELARYPLEVRGSMDNDRKYINSTMAVSFFRNLMEEDSGFSKPDQHRNPITGETIEIDTYDKRIEILESINKFNAGSWAISSDPISIGPLIISKTSEGWKVVAAYSDL